MTDHHTSTVEGAAAFERWTHEDAAALTERTILSLGLFSGDYCEVCDTDDRYPTGPDGEYFLCRTCGETDLPDYLAVEAGLIPEED